MSKSDLIMTLKEGAPANLQVIVLKGSLDEVTSPDARSRVEQLVAGKIFTHIVLDMTDLSYINSKGVGFLVSLHAHLSKTKQKLALVGLSESVNDVLALVGINTIMDCFGSLDEAYQKL